MSTNIFRLLEKAKSYKVGRRTTRKPTDEEKALLFAALKGEVGKSQAMRAIGIKSTGQLYGLGWGMLEDMVVSGHVADPFRTKTVFKK